MCIHSECVFILYRENVPKTLAVALIGGGMYHFLYACVLIFTLTKQRFQAFQ